jgi:hypothetical protein
MIMEMRICLDSMIGSGSASGAVRNNMARSVLSFNEHEMRIVGGGHMELLKKQAAEGGDWLRGTAVLFLHALLGANVPSPSLDCHAEFG